MEFDSIDELQIALQKEQYMADRGLVTAAYLALKLKRPLFLEGEPGVGKTEIAKVLANLLETKLIRLQCYEGLDLNQAAYEWNYTRQMLHIRLLEARGEHARDAELFGREFLLQRPLLEAIEETERARPVLLIDEIDRSDEEFEAFLLEILSDFQITIPEIGTIQAERKPVVILTSNRTREVHDALKRRCIYNWIDYPAFEKEYEIIRAKVPDAPQRLAREVTRFVEELREADLYKIPGVAETIDWTSALVALDQEALSLEIVQDTLGVVLKYQDDIAKINGETARQMLTRVQVSL
jgi:MoxR-like ATPase